MAELIVAAPEMAEGEINYTITRIILATDPEKYKDHEAIIGRLMSIILEYYRRKVAPYEDTKIKGDNDVYKM